MFDTEERPRELQMVVRAEEPPNNHQDREDSEEAENRADEPVLAVLEVLEEVGSLEESSQASRDLQVGE